LALQERLVTPVAAAEKDDAEAAVVLRGRAATAAAPFPRSVEVQWVATFGLGLIVWLTLYLLLSKLDPVGLAATTSFATAVWLPCLETARRAVPPSIGPTFAAATGTAVGVVIGSALESWLHFLAAPIPPLPLLACSAGVFLVTLGWWQVVDRTTGAKQRVMIVGTTGSASQAAADLAAAHSDLFEIVAAVDTEVAPSGGLADSTEFARVLQAQHPDVVVVADEQVCVRVIGPLLDLGAASPRVVGLTGFFEHALGRVPVDRLSVTWFMSLLHLRQRPHSRWGKRLFDIVGAACGLIVLAPIAAVIALLVLRTRGPVIYRQVRVGQAGRPFEIYKFRTMRVDAEADGCCFAAADDSRVTRIGGILRQTHLDEIPQLWNVLRGEMSLVGPRPERPDFVEQLEEAVPFWGRRLLIKPGLTGWAQLHSGYACDVGGATTKLSYDLWYLRHRNVLLDLAICVKTFSSFLGAARGR
jgi:exopolysaccharide biosynthesis polyprenyl glycosylphosphotransferase